MGSLDVDSLREHLDADELVEWARSLVRIDTTNPPGNEAEAALWLRDRLVALGFEEVEVFEPRPGRVSVVARMEPSGPASASCRTLIWNGHLDVVPAGDPSRWRHPPFAGTVAEGRLWGRGSADMKGSVAAALEAVALLRRARIRPKGRLVFMAVADEEMLGELGTGHLVARGHGRADGAICGEPTSLQPVVASRGQLWAEVTTYGRSAHASMPHLGVNAIVKMVSVVQRLSALTLTARHPLLGSATLSIGTICGGTKTNVVPDRCTITLDRRLLPGESAEGALAQLERVLAELKAEDPDLDAGLRPLRHAEPCEISPEEPIVRSVARARALLGLPPAPPQGMPGTTDARFLVNQAGTPTVILGPGDLASAHTVDESISLKELKEAALLYAAVVCDFLGWSEDPPAGRGTAG